MKKTLHWAPRILALAYVVFISLFALDVFGEGTGFWPALGGLFIHLIPSFILLVILWLIWKKDFWGAVFFLALSIAFTIFFETYTNIWSLLLISGSLFLVGLLFLISYLVDRK